MSGLEGAENPFPEISDQLTRLYAQKDATVETVFARLAPLEARLEALERAEADGDAAAARAEAQAIATQLIATRAVAEETRLFSDRIALLEASLPRLSHAQALMMQTLERQAAPGPAPRPGRRRRRSRRRPRRGGRDGRGRALGTAAGRLGARRLIPAPRPCSSSHRAGASVRRYLAGAGVGNPGLTNSPQPDRDDVTPDSGAAHASRDAA